MGVPYLFQGWGDFSRSPSPSPSSGMESSSMKDSPMQLDFGGDTASIGESMSLHRCVIGVIPAVL